MEKAQTGTVHNSETSSVISRVNKTDIDELSKEKEEELLLGAEEEGDDEDTLSDDSLRLRLSDDEETEQEDTATNDAKLKLPSRTAEQPILETILDTVVEKTLCSDVQTVEEVPKPNSEEPAHSKEHNTVKVPENSALDECTSKNERVQDSTHNSEKTGTTVSESNEKCMLKSSKDLKITDARNSCSNAISEKHTTLENDNLSIINKINNRIQTSNLQNAAVIICSEKNPKEISGDSKEIITTCELNKLNNIESNSSFVHTYNVKICNGEKLSTSTIVSNNSDDSLIDKTKKYSKNDDHSLKHTHAELNDSDYVDLIKSDNSNDSSSHKDTIARKSKKKKSEPVDKTESDNVSNTSKITEKVTNTSAIQNQNKSPNVKNNAEVTSKDRDVNNKSVNDTAILRTFVLTLNDPNNPNNENGTKNVGTVVSRRKRTKTIDKIQDTEEDKQEEKESGRQKRKTARNAEEIIRKKYLNSDSDSSASTEEFVTYVKQKLNQDVCSSSPPPLNPLLKRNRSESEIFNGNVKKTKMNVKSEEKKDVAQLSYVEKFFRRDIKERLPKLTQEELEELLIQKIAETITMRSEIGQLREQARISERYQEVTRVKMQQLMKQIKDFEMVLIRNEKDRRANPDKTVPPIKINRSVGLQVSFITEHGIQNLRQAMNKSTVNATNSSISSSTETNNNASSPKRGGIKIRSPRSAVTMFSPVVTQSVVQTAPLIPSVTPAALVVAKPMETQHTLTLSNQPTNVQPILSAPQQQIQSQPQQTLVLNGKIQNQVNRPIVSKLRSNDLIDLTDEEEKNKSNVKVTIASTIDQQLNTTSKPVQSFQRVIQATIPANVAISQPTSIKVITTNQQATPINNGKPPRVAYVMQSASTGSQRPVLITNPTQQVQIRPVSASNRPQFSTVTYKTGTIANGAVRVLTTPVLSNVQINKHPAPLPDIPNYAPTPGWKLPPPAPSLKISKVSNGIVLSWNMSLSDKYADIASYQLYAYQEVAGVNPNTSLWKKVGDVRALPLPMACTLTQFSEGNNYYFAVRAVDTHSRKGQYSIPGNISL
ncbi:PREDICTED: activating transcription factor 7-interacting protein 1 isoform X2 [Wasmannia auropunctata]|uniref:activating transcription factor 7-interacting protein 1 isoform X2 n=1 Tax=Wasmannia auropunctata TaxID=64793 RepID=UPI0005EE7C29|nr:PREDICTED: activating transcription factor 7-interacting protein 1 isoform X2 [Wasmannia auropunctata]